jgi:glycosyltransferase involved in cell wall biosynthesis
MNKSVSRADVSRDEGALSTLERVCIVTGELAGPFYNGGVGTTNRGLALALRRLGYEVDILYTSVGDGKPLCIRGRFADHVAEFANLGIRLECIENEQSLYDWRARSYQALQHLMRRRYQAVFFDDMDGTGYYPMLARKTGAPSLKMTKMCITLHSAVQWILDLNQVSFTFDRIRLSEMERRSIELADGVKAPSQYIIRKYREYGWNVPSDSIVLPNFVPGSLPIVERRVGLPVDEIVFFGRLETRKGLWMFCRALDRLKYKIAPRRVAFLGKATSDTAEALLTRSAAWPFPIRLITNYSAAQAIAYLKKRSRLAVMPSPEDNSPSTIIECIAEGIPFLAASGSGGEELLNPESREQNLFAPTVDALCEALLSAFERGSATAQSSYDPRNLDAEFNEWLRNILESPQRSSPEMLGQSQASPVLMVIAPRGFNPAEVAGELRRVFRAYSGKIEIQVFADAPGRLLEALRSDCSSNAIHVNAVQDYEKVASQLSSRSSCLVGLCHISQLIPPEWFTRASACFAASPDVSAVTGMIAKPKDREPSSSERAEQENRDVQSKVVERFLTGYSPPLFPLAQETNSGFAVIRSEALARCGATGPFDVQYDRIARMQDWIHQILVDLHLAGDRFELIPDLTLAQSVEEPQFEVFRLAGHQRALPEKMYGYVRGSDQAVLARLAVDRGLEQERSLAHTMYIADVAKRIGSDVEKPPLYTPWEKLSRLLARIAHASGQINLAVDLSAGYLAQEESRRPFELKEYLRAVAEGEFVHLVEALGRIPYEMLHLDHELLLAGRNGISTEQAREYGIGQSDRQQLLMRATPAYEGLAALIFPAVDLEHTSHFISIVEVPDEKSAPVRFRIELATDDGLHRWSREKVVRGGEASVWELECPAAFRQSCKVVLSVAMTDRSLDVSRSITRWMDPRFIRRA